MALRAENVDRAYVVPIAAGTPSWSRISWLDIVEQRRRYFHPSTKPNYPQEPVRWFGFRYGGHLIGLYRVNGFIVVNCRSELQRHIPEIDGEAVRLAYDHGERVPHFIYTLDAPLVPERTVRSGKVFGPGSLWIDRDLLLTSESVEEAYRLTKQREGR